MRSIINDSGILLFGKKHKGEDIEDIAREDPSYLENWRTYQKKTGKLSQ